METQQQQPISHYLRLARRIAPIAIIVALVAAAIAVVVSMREPALYQASSQVFVDVSRASSSPADITPSPANPTEVLATQAFEARLPSIAAAALNIAGERGKPAKSLLDESTVVPSPTAYLITFTVTAPRAKRAEALANAYGLAYINYRTNADTGALVKARNKLQLELSHAERAKHPNAALVNTLTQSEQQVNEAALFKGATATAGAPATSAIQVQPKTLRNGILAGFLGLLLGIGIAFIREHLNTRVRDSQEIERALGITTLAYLPQPPKEMENHVGLLADPSSWMSEAYRVLATNLQLTNIDRGAKGLMIASADRREGKTTTTCNLAVALARGGHRVALVDLDLRAPMVHRLFGVDGTANGVTNVALGRTTLDDALIRVPLAGDANETNGDGHARAETESAVHGELSILPSGPLPPSAGEFLTSSAVAEILQELQERFDYLLVDTPPMIHMSDAMTITRNVDGIIVVVRLGEIRRQRLEQLRRNLAAAPAVAVGLVITAAQSDAASFRYDYGYQYSSYAYGHTNGAPDGAGSKGRVRRRLRAG